MANPYETKRYLDEYLLFHYGKPADLCAFDILPRDLLRFHERIRKECLLPIQRAGRAGSLPCRSVIAKAGPLRAAAALRGRAGSPLPAATIGLLDKVTVRRAVPNFVAPATKFGTPMNEPIRALDIGCAVGRFTFELARVADDVLGIDNSRSFITAARNLARKGSANIRIHESGSHFVSKKITLPKNFRAPNVTFAVGNALKLAEPPNGPYHVVAAINLLCRLPSPRTFLRQLPRLIAPGGQFILASPFSWLDTFTPPSEWLSPDAVIKILRPHFRLARRRDLPFLIREHRRKYQLVISHVLTFVRK